MLCSLKGFALNILPRSVQAIGVTKSLTKPAALADSLLPSFESLSLQPRLFSTSPSNLNCTRSLPLGPCSSQNSKLLQPWINPSNIIPGLSSSSVCILSPFLPGGYLVPSRGMKIKGRVKRRCKSCYLIWIDGILHNLCKTHPRHKQMMKPMYFSNMRILTHATSMTKRPW